MFGPFRRRARARACFKMEPTNWLLPLRRVSSFRAGGSACGWTAPISPRSGRGTACIGTVCCPYLHCVTPTLERVVHVRVLKASILTRVHVVQQERLLLERRRALVALERLLARVVPHVHLQSPRSTSSKLIHFKQRDTRYLQALFQAERLVTLRTRVRLVISVMTDVIEPRLLKNETT